MELITLPLGFTATNCYVVACERTREALVVDPGDEAEVILQEIASRGLDVKLIVLTHFHFDHVGAVQEVQQATGAPVGIGAGDAALLEKPPMMFGARGPAGLKAERLLLGGDTLQVGDIIINVIETPGHSPGGISLYVPDEATLFAGDTLFHQGVGRTDLPGSSSAALVNSIHTQLYTLPDDTVVYPGHGPETTIGYEKRHNPFVRARG